MRKHVCYLACWIAVLECSTDTLGNDEPVCRLIPLHTGGACQLGADHVLGLDHSADERMTFTIYSFLVEGANGEKAVVDLGPATTDYLNQMFRRCNFFRDLGPSAAPERCFPDDIVQPEGNVFEHLRRLDISPEHVRHIVFTHPHADHHGMDDAKGGGAAERFPNATLHISAAGWNDNVVKRKDEPWNSDDVYLYRLVADNVLPRIHTSEPNYRAAIDRIVQLAVKGKAIIIPMHDPIVWEIDKTAGADRLRKLREISDGAVQKYLTNATNRPE